jgi:hypothetical protein
LYGVGRAVPDVCRPVGWPVLVYMDVFVIDMKPPVVSKTYSARPYVPGAWKLTGSLAISNHVCANFDRLTVVLVTSGSAEYALPMVCETTKMRLL